MLFPPTPTIESFPLIRAPTLGIRFVYNVFSSAELRLPSFDFPAPMCLFEENLSEYRRVPSLKNRLPVRGSFDRRFPFFSHPPGHGDLRVNLPPGICFLSPRRFRDFIFSCPPGMAAQLGLYLLEYPLPFCLMYGPRLFFSLRQRFS